MFLMERVLIDSVTLVSHPTLNIWRVGLTHPQTVFVSRKRAPKTTYFSPYTHKALMFDWFLILNSDSITVFTLKLKKQYLFQ